MASAREEDVRRFADAYNRGDLDELAGWADPDLEWVTAREHPSAASHRGVEAIRAYHQDWLRLFPGLRIEVESVEERGDRVLAVARLRGTAAGSGAETDIRLGLLSTYRGDRAVRVEEFLDPLEAKQALTGARTPRNGEDGNRSAK
jgi:ketosteroid isomerase-like protein